jgi:transcriptional regulator with XRE-family HTH domain
MPELRPDSVDPFALGARIRDARESSGLTQQQLAERLGLSRTTVVAIEKGERRLKPGELVQAASALGRNVSDLLQQGAPAAGLGAQLRDALPPSAAVAPALLPHIEELKRLCEDYLRLEEICQSPLRRRLDLGEGPLVRLREVLEGDLGIRVFQLGMPANIAGMFVFAEPGGACIATNLNHPIEKRRGSLAQEFGHFLTARYRPHVNLEERFERQPAGERFAMAFARSFLIPASGVRRRFLELEREREKGVTCLWKQ